MRYLYVDNFRGFNNAIVPLLDVNFLVGENSTGKTSLLRVLRVLMSPRVFIGSGFSSEEDVLPSHFGELVTANSTDRSYFRIGLITCEKDKNNASKINGVLLTYEEEQGMARVSRVTSIAGNDAVYIRWRNGGALYRFFKLSVHGIDSNELKGFFSVLLADHTARDITGLNEIPVPEAFRKGDVPLLLIMTLAAQAHGRGQGNDKGMLPVPSIPSQAIQELVWIAPIRTKPRRTYDDPSTPYSSEGAHTPYVIKRTLQGPDAEEFRRFISRIGVDSGLFESIQIRPFGPTEDASAPFAVDALLDNIPLSLSAMGYGVSQALPILVELFDRPSGSPFAIQQPEVHLHPRAQAALGDVFFEIARLDRKTLFIETHSDFTVDRFRMNYRRRQDGPSGQVLFFERKWGHNTVTALAIGRRGELPEAQPDSYRQFFVKEEMELLEL